MKKIAFTIGFVCIALLTLLAWLPQEAAASCVVQVGGQYLSDYDCDTIPDRLDNCVYDYNPFQEDSDSDGIGDACSPLASVEAHASPTSGTEPLNVRLTCDVDGGRAPYLYQWDYDDDGSVDFRISSGSTTNTRTHVYNRGTYHARCIVEDENNDELSGVTEQIMVNAPVQPLTVSADATPRTVPNPFDSFHFSCTAQGGVAPYTYEWEFGDGRRSTQQNPVYSYHEYGDFIATCTATDSRGVQRSDDVAVSVIRPPGQPPVIQGIPDQTIYAGQEFAQFDLDDYTSDPDDIDSRMMFEYYGNFRIMVDIDPTTHVVTLDYPAGFTGTEAIIFKVTDRDGLTDTDTAFFKVLVRQNLPPVLAGIPDQTIYNGDEFQGIDLDAYADDPDNTDAELTFRAFGNYRISVSINPTTHIATFDYPADFRGTETITFKAIDPAGLSDTDAAVFRVFGRPNMPPEIIGIPDQTISCNRLFEDIDLRDYVEDPDDRFETLLFTYSGNHLIGVRISDGIIHFTNPRENVAEQIMIRVEDPAGNTDSDVAVIRVEGCGVNMPPLLEAIPDQTILAGEEFNDFDLDDYTIDPDNVHAELTFSSNGATRIMATINPATHIVHITYPAGFTGSEAVTFRVSDPGGLSDTDTAVFKVEARQNLAPVIQDIPGQTVSCDEQFESVDLRDYVTDPDDSFESIVFSYSGNSEIGVSIVNGILGFSNPGEDVVETVTIKAKDPDNLYDTDSIRLEVRNCGTPQAPVLAGIQDQAVVSGEEFQSIDLDTYAVDPDNANAELTFTTYGNIRIRVDINQATHIARFDYPESFIGSETITFRVTDPDGLTDNDAAIFTVTREEPSAHAPRFMEEVDGQTVSCDEEFSPIPLKDMVEDPDNDVNDLTFVALDNEQIDVDIRHGIAYLANPREDVAETITFKVVDPDLQSDTSSAVFKVKDCEDEEDDHEQSPRISGIPDQAIFEGEEFDIFDLDDFSSDPDDYQGDLEYSVSGEDDLRVRIDRNNRVLVTYPVGFTGAESITFKVRDPDGNVDTDSAVFRVRPDRGVYDEVVVDEFIEDDYYYPPYPSRVYEFTPTPEPNTQCRLVDPRTHKTLPDFDCDSIPDDRDNCPTVRNEKQTDANKNGLGDSCDLQLNAMVVSPQSVDSGETFTVYATVRNMMEDEISQVRIKAALDELGIIQTDTIQTLSRGDSYDASFTLALPECATAKKYNVKLSVEYGSRDALSKTGSITVLRDVCAGAGSQNIVDVFTSQDVYPGQDTVYPIRLVNAGDTAKSYYLRVSGIDGWATSYIEGGNMVMLQPGQERLIPLNLHVSADADPGVRTFTVTITQGAEVQDIVLTANILAKKGRFDTLILVLEILLGILVVIALALAINYALKRRQQNPTVDPDRLAAYY